MILRYRPKATDKQHAKQFIQSISFNRNIANTDLALELSNAYPHDFTLQYPPRREYFKEHFKLHQQKKLLFHLDTLKENKDGRLKYNHYNFLASPKTNSFLDGDNEDTRRLLLYVHVPFCEHKCTYCNFAVDTRASPNLHASYVKLLCHSLNVLNQHLDEDVVIPGIDIGGGTPTLLDHDLLNTLLLHLQPFIKRAQGIQRPLSIETTPKIATQFPDRLEALLNNNVNRVSIGMQSTSKEMLDRLNRGIEKDSCTSSEAIKRLQSLGFERVSVDLIFGLPGQTLDQWKRDLDRVVTLNPDAITTYDCLYRGKGRAMTNQLKSSSSSSSLSMCIPDHDHYGLLYDYAYDFLTENSYFAPYGSVNFSKHRNETGTSAYFEGRLLDNYSYFGVGNYSSSMIGQYWFFNPYHVDEWSHMVYKGLTDYSNIKNPKTYDISYASKSEFENGNFSTVFPIGDCYELPIDERIAKYALLSLSFGILDPKRFKSSLGVDLHLFYSEALKTAINKDWMHWDSEDQVYKLKKGNFRHLSKIRSLFYTPNALLFLQKIKRKPSSQYAWKKKIL